MIKEKKEEIKENAKNNVNFIPPDGRWGWMIVFAAGFSNVST